MTRQRAVPRPRTAEQSHAAELGLHQPQESVIARTPEPRGISALLIPAAMLWFQAVLIRSSADAPETIALILAALGTVGLFTCVPQLGHPTWIRRLMGAAVALILIRLIIAPPVTTVTGYVVIPRTLTITAAELLLFYQVILLWRWHFQEPLPILLPVLAMITMALALNVAMPAGTHLVYAFLVIVALLVPTILASSSDGTHVSIQRKLPRSAKFVLMTVCGAILIGTWVTTTAWSRWLPNAQIWFVSRVGRASQDYGRWEPYATSGSLSAIRAANMSNPNETALRVYSKTSPGYFAGRIFDCYEDKRWEVYSDAARRRRGNELAGLRILRPIVSHMDQDNPDGTSSSFELRRHPKPDSLEPMRIVNDARRGRVYFTPAGTCYVDGIGRWLAVDEFDILRAGISVRTPYRVMANTAGYAETELNERHRQLLLTRLAGGDDRIAKIADEVCRRTSTTQDKIRSIRAYFENNYEYSLEPVAVPNGTDPLTHFLLTRHPAHCEFFASGAVALLREQGIPARYATGFRVLERDEEEDNFWIARNANAHAWAEAYDDQQQRWVIVEATPGFVDLSLDDPFFGANLSMNALQATGVAFTVDQANAFARWWQSIPVSLQITLIASVLLLLGIGIYVLMRRIRRQRGPSTRSPVDVRIQNWQRLLRRMDRRLKRGGFLRQRSETLHQFAIRINASTQEGNNDWLANSADWYLAYESGRFGSTAAQPPALPPRPSRSAIRRNGSSTKPVTVVNQGSVS